MPAAVLGGAGLLLGCLVGEAVAAPLWGRSALGRGDLGLLLALRWWAAVACLAASYWAVRLEASLRPTAWGRNAALLVVAAAAGLYLSSQAALGIARSPFSAAALDVAIAAPALGMVTGVVSYHGDRVTVPVLGLELAGQPSRARLQLSLAAQVSGEESAVVPAPRPGDLIRWTGNLHLPGPQLNPHEYDARRALARAKVSARIQVDDWELVPSSGPGQWIRRVALGPLRLADELRRRLYEAFERSLALPGRAMIAAFVLGERHSMPAAVRVAFEASGSLHLAAVSGLHVGLVAAATSHLLRRLSSPRTARVGTSLVVLCFVLLTGAAAPATRASIVLAVATWPPRGRRSDGLNALALAAGLICAGNPLAAGDPSFQLSFAATLAILASASWQWASVRATIWRRPAQLLSASLAAQAATLPIVVHNFGRICPYAPLNNLLLLPLGSLVITVYLGISVLTLLWPPVLSLLAPVVQGLAHLLLWPANGLGRLPGSLWAPGHPGIIIIVLAALGIPLALAAVAMAGRQPALKAIQGAVLPGIAGLIVLVIVAPLVVHRPPRCLTVTFFAVGQGDAALVRLGRAAVLVDLGPPARDPASASSAWARKVMPVLWATRVRPDVLVISHPHAADHIGGLREAAHYLPGAAVLVRETHLAETEHWLVPAPGGLPIAAGAGALTGLSAPEQLALSTSRRSGAPHLVLELFWAPLDDLNEGSLALRARAGPGDETSVLFTGDAGFQAERLWQRDHRGLLRASVLKVGHHGSAGSSGDLFLHDVAAAVAVIPVGPNRFGHPAAAALERLEAAVPLVLRTDQDGYIEVHLCPTHLEVRRWRAGL